jgi:hypothetical protein
MVSGRELKKHLREQNLPPPSATTTGLTRKDLPQISHCLSSLFWRALSAHSFEQYLAVSILHGKTINSTPHS